jgi:Cu+-exporting ATPase
MEDPMKVTDPVCDMQIESETAAAKVEYGGKTYYFCSQGCKTKFEREPARYAS